MSYTHTNPEQPPSTLPLTAQKSSPRYQSKPVLDIRCAFAAAKLLLFEEGTQEQREQRKSGGREKKKKTKQTNKKPKQTKQKTKPSKKKPKKLQNKKFPPKKPTENQLAKKSFFSHLPWFIIYGVWLHLSLGKRSF